MSVVSTEASAIQQFVTSNKTDEFCEGLDRSSPIPGNWYASKLCLITTVETCLVTAISPGPSPGGEGSQNPWPAGVSVGRRLGLALVLALVRPPFLGQGIRGE